MGALPPAGVQGRRADDGRKVLRGLSMRLRDVRCGREHGCVHGLFCALDLSRRFLDCLVTPRQLKQSINH
eukprot:5925495-Alexandrium_andersonii.AAC.1